MVKNGHLKPLFAQIRLADTGLAATRCYRQIEPVRLVFLRQSKFIMNFEYNEIDFNVPAFYFPTK